MASLAPCITIGSRRASRTSSAIIMSAFMGPNVFEQIYLITKLFLWL